MARLLSVAVEPVFMVCRWLVICLLVGRVEGVVEDGGFGGTDD